ncbi:MAG: heavy metal translocating P-type ATPase, partial [Bacteroidales bacterium]|nr:heavy metal translocating P-type ATPase [Bacteroidales bacterium]
MHIGKEWLPQAVSFLLLATGILLEHLQPSWFLYPWVDFVWFAVAFLPVGAPVAKEAVEAFAGKDFFNEFTLMLLASIGAFYIGEYPEAVAVMLFYAVGEELQESAVRRSRRNIRELLEMRPDRVRVIRGGKEENTAPETVATGETIETAVGERVCIDGVLISGSAHVDTSALTGESLPRFVKEGEEIPAGCVVLEQSVRLKTLRPYHDSALAKMARLVEEAAKRKAPNEIFISRISLINTPVVILAAIHLAGKPA